MGSGAPRVAASARAEHVPVPGVIAEQHFFFRSRSIENASATSTPRSRSTASSSAWRSKVGMRGRDQDGKTELTFAGSWSNTRERSTSRSVVEDPYSRYVEDENDRSAGSCSAKTRRSVWVSSHREHVATLAVVERAASGSPGVETPRIEPSSCERRRAGRHRRQRRHAARGVAPRRFDADHQSTARPFEHRLPARAITVWRRCLLAPSPAR